ncbi:TPA: hypothetical protein H1940_004732 [Salmonella enterica]|nr:hypothetical protein [Salmonella enterica]
MFETELVTVEILNDGSYDGMKHLTFPIRIENCLDYGLEVGMVDVPVDALVAAGYDRVKGLTCAIPDCLESDMFLPFSYDECLIVE